jgi:predicted transcriptional regulator
MQTLIELTAKIVAQHAKKTAMTQAQLLQDMHLIHSALQLMDQEVSSDPLPEEPKTPTLTIKQAFKKNEVICMICNKGGLKTLTRHIRLAHGLKPGQYRKTFGIKGTQKLAAKSFSEAMAKAALDRGQGEILAKAREKRTANIAKKKTSIPAVKVKHPA